MAEDLVEMRAAALAFLADGLDLPIEIRDVSEWRNHYSAYFQLDRDFVYLRDVRISDSSESGE